ncbi:MAG TPA: efflux RND transporter periplasmic adaptor subunit [Syntrophorhabdales bacterium]|nr:efflux RND transporter periplasmic adaptor subunit [Syntrophorhabdales bacterium]
MARFSLKKWIIVAVIPIGVAGFYVVAKILKAAEVGASTQMVAPLLREEGSVRVPETSPLRKSLRVAAVEERSVERSVVVPGVVEADPAKLIKVMPPVSGRIVQLHKHLGDEVKSGEALFTLDSADLAQAYSDASKAQTALNLARRNLDRQKELNAAGISARKELEQAESDYGQATSEAERSKTRLSLLGVSLGQGSGRLYTLHSPIAGRVIELAGAQGAFWNDMNAPIMTVANLSTVWLAASVQEKDIAFMFAGQTVQISLNAYDGESFKGRVRYVGEMLDPDTRTVKVRIAIDNASGRFRPGMFAKVAFSCQAHKAIVVPATALLQSGFTTRVFVETSPWKFESRVCKTGAQFGDNVEIVSGLKAGERIVVKEGVLLND